MSDYTEDHDSREEIWTDEGVTFLRQFSVPWTEWRDGTFATYYAVGSSLTADGEFTTNSYGLYVARANARQMTPTYAKVTLLYSTKQSRPTMKKQPGRKASWEESFDIGTDAIPVNFFYEGISGHSEKTWKDLWTDAGNDEANLPELVQHRPYFVFNVSAYADTLFIKRILTNIGSINKYPFIQEYLGQTDSGLVDDSIALFNDTYCWLFNGCPINRPRYDCWEYKFNFVFYPANYDTIGGGEPAQHWNKPYRVAINMYPTYDFMKLFGSMSSTADLETPIVS